jgi:hypothetical protein
MRTATNMVCLTMILCQFWHKLTISCREPLPQAKEHGRFHQARVCTPIDLYRHLLDWTCTYTVFSQLQAPDCSIVKNEEVFFGFVSTFWCAVISVPVSCRVFLYF